MGNPGSAGRAAKKREQQRDAPTRTSVCRPGACRGAGACARGVQEARDLVQANYWAPAASGGAVQAQNSGAEVAGWREASEKQPMCSRQSPDGCVLGRASPIRHSVLQMAEWGQWPIHECVVRLVCGESFLQTDHTKVMRVSYELVGTPGVWGIAKHMPEIRPARGQSNTEDLPHEYKAQMNCCRCFRRYSWL